MQDLLPATGVSSEVRTDIAPSLPSLPSPVMSTPLWPRQDPDSLAQMNQSDFGISTPLVADCNVSGLPACFQCDVAPFENSVLEEHWFCGVFLFLLSTIGSNFSLDAYLLFQLLIFARTTIPNCTVHSFLKEK